MLQSILGIVSFIGAIVIFSSAFIQGNWILTSSVAILIAVEGGYYFATGKENWLKGTIKIISTLTLLASVFFRLPFYISIIVGGALLVVALYDVFPTIIGKD